MSKVCLGFGSNLGDSLSILQNAWHFLGEHPAIKPVCFSSPYRTEPVGMESSNWFVNAVGCVETSLQPAAMMAVLLSTEMHFGRVRQGAAAGHQDRTLDLDLLLFDDLILNSPDLIIPHPHLHERLFVLAPLAEIGPQIFHSVLKRSMNGLFMDLLNRLNKPAFEKINWPGSC